MKTINFRNAIGTGFLALSLLLGIGAVSMTAQAQDRWGQDDRYDRDQRDRDGRRNRDWRNDRRRGRSDDGYSNLGGSFQLRQTALNAGANEGVKAGREDRRRGERHEFRDEGAYQKATKDYSSRLGDRNIYMRYFREAFQNGYADGYAGY